MKPLTATMLLGDGIRDEMKPWQYRGNTVAIPWQYRGNIVAIPWQYRGNIVAISWQYRSSVHIYFNSETFFGLIAGSYYSVSPKILTLIFFLLNHS